MGREKRNEEVRIGNGREKKQGEWIGRKAGETREKGRRGGE